MTTETYVPIKIKVQYEDGSYVAFVEDENFPQLKSCVDGGETEEEARKNLLDSIKATMSFYEEEMFRGWKLAIFRGNASRMQLWFTIVGIGIVFYWNNSSSDDIKYKPGYDYHIGKLYFSFMNEWKR